MTTDCSVVTSTASPSGTGVVFTMSAGVSGAMKSVPIRSLLAPAPAPGLVHRSERVASPATKTSGIGGLGASFRGRFSWPELLVAPSPSAEAGPPGLPLFFPLPLPFSFFLLFLEAGLESGLGLGEGPRPDGSAPPLAGGSGGGFAGGSVWDPTRSRRVLWPGSRVRLRFLLRSPSLSSRRRESSFDLVESLRWRGESPVRSAVFSRDMRRIRVLSLSDE